MEREERAMATKSIRKNVKITSSQAECFIHILEEAEASMISDVDLSKSVKHLSRESIQKIFS